jgi:hypothetical protein
MTSTESTETHQSHRDTARRIRLLIVGSLSLVANIGFTFFFITVATILLDGGVARPAGPCSG